MEVGVRTTNSTENKRTRSSSVVLILVAALYVAGCHTMRFQLVGQPHSHVVKEKKPFFLWGLAPTAKVDVASKCPHGVAAVREQTTFLDGLIGLLTIGLCQTRTSWYYCLDDGRQVTR